ncbi:MAG: class C sortase [Eubacteriales bacterium]|nr:class C sortase [Eubacteriales bacterium]
MGLLLVGFCIFAYPLFSQYVNYRKQMEQVDEYGAMVSSLPTEEGKRILAAATAYNAKLARTDQNVFSEEKLAVLTAMYQAGEIPAYFLAEKLIGTLEIPKLDVKLPIYSGTNEHVLQKGIGHLLNSSLPIGGKGTHAVLTGHRGLPSARLFRDLDRLAIGDFFFVQVLDEPHAYLIDRIEIIEPTDTTHLGIEADEDYITLLTCHPYMVNSQRLILRGHRIEYTKQLEASARSVKEDYRWILFLEKYKEYLIGIGIFLVLLLIMWRRERRNGRKAKETDEKIK